MSRDIRDPLTAAESDPDGVRLEPPARIRAWGDRRTRTAVIAGLVALAVVATVGVLTARLDRRDLGVATHPTPAPTTAKYSPPPLVLPTDQYAPWAQQPETLTRDAIPLEVFGPGPFVDEQWSHVLGFDPYYCFDLSPDQYPSKADRIAARQVHVSYPRAVVPGLAEYVGLYRGGGAAQYLAELRQRAKPCHVDVGGKVEANENYATGYAGDESLLTIRSDGYGTPGNGNEFGVVYDSYVRVGNAVLVLELVTRQTTPGDPDEAPAADLKTRAQQFAERAAQHL
jgi:hypothetical protein